MFVGYFPIIQLIWNSFTIDFRGDYIESYLPETGIKELQEYLGTRMD